MGISKAKVGTIMLIMCTGVHNTVQNRFSKQYLIPILLYLPRRLQLSRMETIPKLGRLKMKCRSSL
jgi:hypothetical protein